MTNKKLRNYLILSCTISAFLVGGIQPSYAANMYQNTKQVVSVKNAGNKSKANSKHKKKHKQVKEEEYFLDYDIISEYLDNKNSELEGEAGKIVKKIKIKLFIKNLINDIIDFIDII